MILHLHSLSHFFEQASITVAISLTYHPIQQISPLIIHNMKYFHLSKSLPQQYKLPSLVSIEHEDQSTGTQEPCEKCYIHPADPVINSFDENTCSCDENTSNFDANRKKHMTDRHSSKYRSSPLPIPFSASSRQEEREEEIRQELVDTYNNKTWQMYHLIHKARCARTQNMELSSRSEDRASPGW